MAAESSLVTRDRSDAKRARYWPAGLWATGLWGSRARVTLIKTKTMPETLSKTMPETRSLL
jgi:hypothetical protein